MKPASQFTERATSKKMLINTLLLLALTFSPLANAASQPAPMAIPDNLSCGVCGMYPAKFVKWQTQIIFTDGVMVPFDGSKDMFKYILKMAKYDKKHTNKDISAIWVKGFDNSEWLDGNAATYVVGSKEMGPMGKELIPFFSPTEALTFKKKMGGMIMNYDDVTMDDIKKLGMGGMKMKSKMKGKM